jgi:hypothetical protein
VFALPEARNRTLASACIVSVASTGFLSPGSRDSNLYFSVLNDRDRHILRREGVGFNERDYRYGAKATREVASTGPQLGLLPAFEAPAVVYKYRSALDGEACSYGKFVCTGARILRSSR